MSLNESLPDINFRRIDSVLHLAFDMNGVQPERNYDGTVRIMQAAHDAGVSRQLFVSSYSARRDAVSNYGQIKFRLEERFLERGYQIVRPGLVLGNGGLVGRMIGAMKFLPAIPLPSGGHGEIPFVSLPMLCQAICRIVDQPGKREHNIFSRHYTSLRTLIQRLREVIYRRPTTVILPIPDSVMLAGLSIASRLPVALPVNIDNLKGFLHNQSRCHESTIEEIGIRSEQLVEAIEAGLAH